MGKHPSRKLQCTNARLLRISYAEGLSNVNTPNSEAMDFARDKALIWHCSKLAAVRLWLMLT